MTDLPGKVYQMCRECQRYVQVYPTDWALSIWSHDGMVVCRACADGPHEEDDDREEEP